MHELLDSGPADMVGAGQQMTKTASTRQRPRSKWHLGIRFGFSIRFYPKIVLRSQSNSMHVMKEVYRALHELGFLWRNISFFRIRVKMDSKRYPGRHEKMNITLYRSPRCSERSPGIFRSLLSVKNRFRLLAGLFVLPDGERARAVGR